MRAAFVLFAFPLVVACAALPRLGPAGSAEQEACAAACRAPFLCGGWRLVHAINGTLPGGSNATMIAVTLAAPGTGRIRCTLMSIEGLVLLDAEHDGKLAIHRGVGPLASPDMVTGMIRDIRLMLFRPAGSVLAGSAAGGRGVCRYAAPEGTIDVSVDENGASEVRLYDTSSRLSRTVRLCAVNRDGLPATIELSAFGAFRYSLRLDLIEAERLR